MAFQTVFMFIYLLLGETEKLRGREGKTEAEAEAEAGSPHAAPLQEGPGLESGAHAP